MSITQTLNTESNLAVSALLTNAQNRKKGNKKRMRCETEDIIHQSPPKKRKLDIPQPLQTQNNHNHEEAFGFSSDDDDDDDSDNPNEDEDGKMQDISDKMDKEPHDDALDLPLFDHTNSNDLNQTTNSLQDDPYWNMMQDINKSKDNLMDLDDADKDNPHVQNNTSGVSIQIDIDESSMFNVSNQSNAKKKKKKKEARRYQKWQRDQGIECTQAHLALLGYRARFRTLLCTDCELQARMMSILPLKLHPNNDTCNGIYTEITLLKLRQILQWFLNTFQYDVRTKQFELKCPTAKDRIPCGLTQLMEYIIEIGENKTHKKKCSVSHLNLLFLTLLWSFNIPARMVYVLRPITHILKKNKIYDPEHDYTQVIEQYFPHTPCVCQQIDTGMRTVDEDIEMHKTSSTPKRCVDYVKNMGKAWTKDDDQYLWIHRDDEVESLAVHFARSRTAIRNRLEHIAKDKTVHDDKDKAVKRKEHAPHDAMDVDAKNTKKKKKKGAGNKENSNKKWIVSDDIYLWEYRDDPVHVLANVLNRTNTSIQRRLESLRQRTSKARQRLFKHLPSNSTSKASFTATEPKDNAAEVRGRPDFSYLGQHFVYASNKGSMVECVEVYVSDIAQWVHIVLDKGRIHIDLSENNLFQCDCDRNTNKISYAISVDKFGCISDVTPRYAEIWSVALHKRVMHHAYYMDMLQKWDIANEETAFQYGWQCVMQHESWRDLLKRDRVQINKCIASEPIPKSEGLFRNHPLFVIEKFVKKYEAIHPKDESQVIGKVKGQNVYPISNLRNLHTRERWYKLGYVVKDGEEYIKQVKTSHMSKSEEEFTDLFGKWQCVKYVAPTIGAKDKLPTNSRGNIELWSDEHLPKGCVHIKQNGAIFAAKRMKIEYAKAMVGFDQRKGRSVPVFEGIVVHQSYEDELRTIIKQMDVKRKEREEEKEMKMMCGLWRMLVQGIMVQQQLESQQREKEANKRIMTTKEFNAMVHHDHVEDL
eukprot:124830_1